MTQEDIELKPLFEVAKTHVQILFDAVQIHCRDLIVMRDTTKEQDLVYATFLYRQRIHAQSLLKLGQHLDSMLVARSMLEAAANLRWITADKARRCALWRNADVIADWRKLQWDRKNGYPLPADADEIERRFEENKELFLTKDGQKAYLSKKPLDDHKHFWLEWQQNRIYFVFKEIGLEALYKEAYSRYSSWHHGNITGYSTAMRRIGDGPLEFTSGSYRSGFDSLLTSHFSMTSVAIDAAAHFDNKIMMDGIFGLSQAFHAQLEKMQ